MTRRYDEPIEVRRRDEVPAEFLWRGRLYVVREVFSCWVESDPWWTGAPAQALYGCGEEVELGVDATAVSAGMPGGMPTAGSSAGGLPAGAVAEIPEREMWRIEASAGRSAGSGVYDLSYESSVNRWQLAQVVD